MTIDNEKYTEMEDEFVRLKEKRETEVTTLLNLCKSFIFMLENANNDPFANGVTHDGVDEGNVNGWGYFKETKQKVEEFEKAFMVECEEKIKALYEPNEKQKELLESDEKLHVFTGTNE